MSAPHESTRPIRQIPEPARFWIGDAPRSWRPTDSLWSDLARVRLEGLKPQPEAGFPGLDVSHVEELLYLPPVASELAQERDRAIAEFVEAGVSVLVQLTPGEPLPAAPVTVVYDLLVPLLEGDLEIFTLLPEGSAAAWPLIAGLTDRPETWDEACELLARAKVKTVQPVILELSPRARRRLAEDREDETFDALFHSTPPTERSFSRIAHRYGLRPFIERPAIAGPARRLSNRRLGTRLALIGEIWMRLGRPTVAGQAFFRAARGAESTVYDLAALAREKNLGVLGWLDAGAMEVITQFVEEGTTPLLAELEAEYLGEKS